MLRWVFSIVCPMIVFQHFGLNVDARTVFVRMIFFAPVFCGSESAKRVFSFTINNYHSLHCNTRAFTFSYGSSHDG